MPSRALATINATVLGVRHTRAYLGTSLQQRSHAHFMQLPRASLATASLTHTFWARLLARHPQLIVLALGLDVLPSPVLKSQRLTLTH
jgi:hypothetical protein